MENVSRNHISIQSILYGFVFVLVLFSNLSAAGAADPVFVDVAAEYGVADTTAACGAMWLDFDNDGDLDLLVASSNTSDMSRLYQNNGNGFEDVAAQVGFGSGHPTALVHISGGDYDNDGDVDLLTYSGGYGLRENRYNDTGQFVDMGGVFTWGVFVDIDNNGDLDIYKIRFGDENELFTNLDGEYNQVYGALGLNNSSFTRASVWGDYDGDGDMDVYVVNGRGNPNALYRNDIKEREIFTDVTSDMGVACKGVGYGNGACWGDFDNDGDLDLYVVTLGSNVLFQNDINITGSFTDVTDVVIPDYRDNSTDAKWADYDNDGDLDLYLCSSNINRLFRNDLDEGNGFIETGEMANVQDFYSGGSWGDFDRDGDLDFYLATPGINRLYQNQGNNNHWLHLELEGIMSNRSAIGAMVYVYTENVQQMRFVEPTSGMGSQNSLPVEFGLGSNKIVDSIRIEWPSGIVWDTTDVAADQMLRIKEYSPVTAYKASLFPVSCLLHQNHPNPFNPFTQISYSIADKGHIRLTVYDITGREMIRLVDEEKSPGNYTADFNGSALASGVYVYRLEAGGRVMTRKMVLMK